MLKEVDVAYIHAAVPCGTASRARDKPIPSKFLRAGAPQPRPLRSEKWPRGLPGLSSNEEMRVKMANEIYDFVCLLFIEYHHKLLWTLENPFNSYFWMVDTAVLLAQLPGVSFAKFQQCMHGGQRPVWRKWLSNFPEITGLNAECDGAHEHLPFRIQNVSGEWRFSTAEEAEYPRKLCNTVANIVVQKLIGKGYAPAPPELLYEGLSNVQLKLVTRATTGKFIRGKRLPQIISEFGSVEPTFIPSPEVGQNVETGDVHGKVLRLISGGEDGAENQDNCAVGVFRTPQEFATDISKIPHPMDQPPNLQNILIDNIAWNLEHTAVEISTFRLGKIREIRELAAGLRCRNDELLSQVPPRAKAIATGKNIALLEYYIKKLNWPDDRLIQDLLQGFHLSGTMSPSGIFPQKVKLATVSSGQLRSSAKWCRRAIISKVASAEHDDMESKLWEQMQSECDKKWCRGPFTESQVTTQVGNDDWLCNRRFGLQQKTKVRDIDDYTEAGPNDSITTVDKLELHDIDDAVMILRTIHDAVKSRNPLGEFCITAINGHSVSGKSSSLNNESNLLDWVGKTFDLKAAYKNLFTHDDDRWFTIIVLRDPTSKEARFFLQDALPFGATGSVIAFNRCSKLIWAIACHELRVLWLSYFDDYPALERRDTSCVTDMALRSLFLILGWELSSDESKSKPYSKEFNVLGVVLDMNSLAHGDIVVSNKQDRVQEISEAIGNVLDSGKCMRPMAANLRGRMQYASNQIFGRVALSLLAELSQHQFHSSSPFISVELREALVWFRVLILTERPRTLSLLGERKPVFIFSDGACEGDRFNNVTVGAVLFDAANGTKEMFGCSICKEVVDFWKSDSPDKDQTIAQAEILPAILSRVIWRRYLLHRRVVFCLDNDSARLSLIKGTSASPSSRILIRSNLQAETVSMSFSWYARVPTHSNPGDGPSRLQLIPGPENLFATCVNAPPDDLIIQLAISGTLPAFT
jgi:hypothetical protein